MSDIVDRLQTILTTSMRPGTADSDVNVFDLPIEVTRGDVERSIREILQLRATIAQLRAVAGSVSVDSFSYADLKKDLAGGGTRVIPGTGVPVSEIEQDISDGK